MIALTWLAQLIGFIVLGLLAALAIMAAATAVHDFIRAHWRAYDLWFYDDVRRWNRRRRGASAQSLRDSD
jgi:hypothetical protein